VAKEYNQHVGLDYDETFSPIIKFTTIQVVLSIATSKIWPIKQIDIQNAFLYDILLEEVHMKQLLGFTRPQFSNHMCMVHNHLWLKVGSLGLV
jgi:hypothetical protein